VARPAQRLISFSSTLYAPRHPLDGRHAHLSVRPVAVFFAPTSKSPVISQVKREEPH